MAASLSGVWNLQEFTDAGVLMASGRLYTYAPATTTQKAAYTDAAGSVAHTYTSDGVGGQYIALNARGELPAPLFLTSGGYDLTLKTSAGATVWTRRAAGQEDLATTLDTALRADLADTSSAAKGAALVKHDYSRIYPVKSLGLASFGRPPSTWAMSDAQAADVLANTGSLDVSTPLNTIIATGYPIDFTNGTYGIGSPLTPLTQQTLSGRKRSKVIIKALTGFAGTAMVNYPSGTYSGVTIEGMTINGNGKAARCLSMVGASQGAVDQIIVRDVSLALATVRPCHLEFLTYWELDHVLTNGGSDGAYLLNCFDGSTKNCLHYEGVRAALIVVGCDNNDFGNFAIFNNAGNTSTSLLEVDGGKNNDFHDYSLEPQGVANVTQELLINDTVSGNCVQNMFRNGRHIGLANTKTRSVVMGSSGTIYQTLFENVGIIKPTGQNSMLFTAQQETHLENVRDLVAYDTPNFVPVTVTDNSGFGYSANHKQNLTLTLTGSTTNPTTPAAAGGFSAPAVKNRRSFFLEHNFGAVTWAGAPAGNFEINLPYAVTGHVQIGPQTVFAAAVVGYINGTKIVFYIAGSATPLTWAAATSGGSLTIAVNGFTDA